MREVAAGYGPGRGGRFSEELLDEIRAKSDIVAVIGEYVPLKKRGHNFLGLCPFHPEKTPSFTVSPERQMFYCFGCQTGGNVFSFLMQREGLAFYEAVEQLADRAGVVLPAPERRRPARVGAGAAPDREGGAEAAAEPGAETIDDGGSARRREDRELLYRVMSFAARYYNHTLKKSPEAETARLYLQRRGIRPESIDLFLLGYSPRSWDSLLRALRAKGVAEAVLERAGLILKGQSGYYDRFRGRLMFAISDHRGRPIGFGARALYEGDEPKYLNSPETPLFSKGRVLYALHQAAPAIRRGDSALVVEGYMDAIACHEFGFDHTAASMGTAFTAEQARILRRYTDTVITAFDADAAGTMATVRGLEVLTAAGFKVKVAEMPGGKDPDDCLRGGGDGGGDGGAPEGGRGDSGGDGDAPGSGVAAFRASVEGAVPLPEYRFRLALRRSNPADIDGRVAVVDEILPVLAGIDGPVEREEYLRDFARRLPVPEAALRAELIKYVEAAASKKRSGVRAGIEAWRSGESRRDHETWRHNEEGPRERGERGNPDLPRPIRAAERTLLRVMTGPEEDLHTVLAELLEAAAWCRSIGLSGGKTPAGEVAATDEAAQARATAARDEATDVAVAADEATPDEPSELEREALRWFADPIHRRVAQAVLDQARNGPVSPARLVDALAGDEAAHAFAGTLAGAGGASSPEEIGKAIHDCVGVLKEHRLNSRIELLHRRITDLEHNGVEVEREYPELIGELIDLERHTDGGTGHWKVPDD